MEFKVLILLLFTIILSLLNYYQKKFKFCLDHATTEEKHKKLLSLNNQTPLSGTIYFFIITSILFYEDESYLLIPCIFFFGIGFFADLKILKSPKLRLILQFLILLIFFSIFHEIKIDLRIDLLNKLMQKNIFNVLIVSFFLLVLVNGYNFIDGVNNLSSLNFLIILTFIYLLCESINIYYLRNSILVCMLAMVIFVIFNFFGKNFLGDGATYGLSFFIGYILIRISFFDDSISPYFIANLLWYPAFENLFTILRRSFNKDKNYLPDNKHLHQMIFKFIIKKKIFKQKFLCSSIAGISINIFLLILYIIGYFFKNQTDVQIYLIITGILFYLFLYNSLRKYI
jgi:UDP-N-acetylmuramyl pentapeptide phosphotransferase/UDP-N-acetylglucosamine-1-phosphate transferase